MKNLTNSDKKKLQKYLRIAFDKVTSYKECKDIYQLIIKLDLDSDFRAEMFMDMEEM